MSSAATCTAGPRSAGSNATGSGGAQRQLQAWPLRRRDGRHSSVAEASNSRGEGADSDMKSVGHIDRRGHAPGQRARGGCRECPTRLDSGQFGRGQEGRIEDRGALLGVERLPDLPRRARDQVGRRIDPEYRVRTEQNVLKRSAADFRGLSRDQLRYCCVPLGARTCNQVRSRAQSLRWGGK